VADLQRNGWPVCNGITGRLRPEYAGDYGVVHPDPFVGDPRTINSRAKIRYTLEKEWLIISGHSLRKPPKYAQYFDLSEKLVNHREYMGSDYSPGDKYAFDCASQRKQTGNPTKWIEADTSHHITFVGEQVANLS